jgi:hypothetical protein
MEKISRIKEERDLREKRKISPIQEALEPLSMETWKKANWPVITYASKRAFIKMTQDKIVGQPDPRESFWLEVFNPKRFFSLKRDNGYDSEKHFLFILHSFSNKDKLDAFFKAITTTEESLLEDPENIINYELHGKPCEKRGGGSYPSCDFWNLCNGLEDDKLLEKYSIPDTVLREKFIRENFTD